MELLTVLAETVTSRGRGQYLLRLLAKYSLSANKESLAEVIALLEREQEARSARAAGYRL